jgi:hypothetical protein
MSSFWVHRKRDMECLPSRSFNENVAKAVTSALLANSDFKVFDSEKGTNERNQTGNRLPLPPRRDEVSMLLEHRRFERT